MAKNAIFNTVEEAIEDFREGRIVIVVDDEDRENEGDFIVAAEKITPEIVNFMLSNGRGVLCAPLSESRCEELELNMMEENNTSLLGTPFTVTVDLLGQGCTTGRLDPRPRRHDPCAGRSRHPSVGSGASGPCQSAACPREGGAAPAGTYRSGRRSGPSGRIASPAAL